MRSLALLLLLAGTAASAFAVKRVTVAQLEQEVIALRGKPDAKAARQLSDLELTERLSTARFAGLQTENSWAEGTAGFARTCGYVGVPRSSPCRGSADTCTGSPHPAPNSDQSDQLCNRTVRQLPNFSASRVTTRFEDIDNQPLHFAGVSNLPVTFRDGQEAVVVAAESKTNTPAMSGLTTKGEFGPILFTVLLDIAHSTVKWKHWEEAPGKTLAVFSFKVPREQSHYQTGACCQTNDASRAIPQFSAYHGQIAIDPEEGTVFRIMVQAELQPEDSISRADIFVEYGRVEIGGRYYICPEKSVAILVDKVVPASTTASFHNGQISPAINGQSLPRQTQTQLDDVAFTQYHVFRADSRMLPVETSDQPEELNGSRPAAAKPTTNGP